MPVRPVVAVDIDGTLTQYHHDLAAMASAYWGTQFKPGHLWNGQGNFEDYLGLTHEQYQETKLAFRQGGFKRWATPQPGAIDFMHNLARLDVEIWITTTRPWNRLDSVDPDTRFWMDRHNIKYDHLLYDDHKYMRLAELVDPQRVVACVDDLPPMLQEAFWAFGTRVPIQIRRPHNESTIVQGAWLSADFHDALIKINDELEARRQHDHHT